MVSLLGGHSAIRHIFFLFLFYVLCLDYDFLVITFFIKKILCYFKYEVVRKADMALKLFVDSQYRLCSIVIDKERSE